MAPHSRILFRSILLLVVLATVVFADLSSSFVVSDIKFAVVGYDSVRKGGESVNFPDNLKSKYTIQETDTLRVSLQVLDAVGKPLLPHQAFLVLTNEETGAQSVQILKVRDSGKAKAELTPKTAPNLLVGPYKLDLVFGTFSLPDSLKYALGSVNFEPKIDLAKTNEPPAYYGGSREVTTYGPRPEIQHVFRQPEKTPAPTLSNVFVLVVLTPWLVLLGAWLFLGVTSTIGSFSISILAFFASLVGTEFLFYRYWTSLNIFETLSYFTGLAVVAFITGQRALSEVQARRLKSEMKHIKKE